MTIRALRAQHAHAEREADEAAERARKAPHGCKRALERTAIRLRRVALHLGRRAWGAA